MASVPIQIDGVLWDKANKSGRAVTLMGQAHIMGLSVGGGPIVPPDTSGGLPPHPEFPISGPPGIEFPDVPGYPPVATQPPLPEPPPEGETPPTGPLGKMEWHTVWTADYGWAVIGVPVDPHVVPSKRK